MNYKRMSISEGARYPAFWWYATVELCLLGTALYNLSLGNILECVAIFILIEVREINAKSGKASQPKALREE